MQYDDYLLSKHIASLHYMMIAYVYLLAFSLCYGDSLLGGAQPLRSNLMEMCLFQVSGIKVMNLASVLAGRKFFFFVFSSVFAM